MKRIAIIENSLPNSHWEYWNDYRSKRLYLYFTKGKIINKK